MMNVTKYFQNIKYRQKIVTCYARYKDKEKQFMIYTFCIHHFIYH